MLNNYLTVINAIDTFCANHANIHRFKSSFFEQMDDFSTSGNSFPIFYAVPNDIAMEENIDVMSFRIYCLDILQKDRVNEEAILNSTYQNLRDLVNWLRNDEYNDLNVLNSPRAIPVNNFLVDFTTGWYIDTELEVSVVTNDCAIPFTNNFQLTGTSCDVSYITPYLTCATVTGCTTLQEYVAQQINNSLTGGTGGGFEGWTAGTAANTIIQNNANNIADVQFAFAAGTNNSNSAFNSSILGGFKNIIAPSNPPSPFYTSQNVVIVGGAYNQVNANPYSTASNSFIGGGYSNSATSKGTIIVAGSGNLASQGYASIVGGTNNVASGQRSFIGNGYRNNVSGTLSSVLNGNYNSVTGYFSSVLGGLNNTVTANYSSILGGKNITASQSDTVYVPFLNVQSASTDNALTDVFVRDVTGEVKLRSVSSIAPVFSGTTDFYSKFTSGGSLSNGMISDNGVLSNLRLAASGDNINVSIISPSGFYYPSLTFVNNGATTVGQITGYAGRLYTSPLSVGGTIDMGANKIVNLSPGTNPDDAINLGQLKDVTILSSTTACTISIDAFNSNYSITALTSACTFSVVSGNEQNFDRLIVRIKDGGVAQSLTFDPANFEAKGQALPTTTVANKLLTAGFIYDDLTGKFGCVTVAQEI